VLVVGGGAAGVAAAVVAARRGVRVILVERYGFCGGGAVAGMSGTICGMYAATDDRSARPLQVVHGFLDDFVAEMERRGGLAAPVRYGKTFTRVRDPLIWRESADALLAEAGVQVLFHTTVTGALVEGGEKVEGVVAYTKEGPATIAAKVTIDASGDADVVAMAGFPSFIGQDGRVQNPTMIFRLLGIDVARFRAEYGDDTIMGEAVSTLIRDKSAGNEYNLPRAKIWLFPTTRPNELRRRCVPLACRVCRTPTCTPVSFGEVAGVERVELAPVGPDDPGTVAQNDKARLATNQVIAEKAGIFAHLPAAFDFGADVLSGAKFRDGIARSPWPIELHAGTKPRVEWLLDDVYEIPYGCFVPQRGEGLLTAGRCLSAEHEAVASARVTAQCFSYGHAIGAAAAVCALDGLAPRSIDGATLRAELNRDGARLDMN
jgi:hypothetical protein